MTEGLLPGQPAGAWFGGATRAVRRIPADASGAPARVLKVLSAGPAGPTGLGPGTSQAVGAFNYWAREHLFYASGLVRDRHQPVQPPDVHEIEHRPDGSVWLWMDEVVEQPTTWSVADYARAAWHLGRFNASYLETPPSPEHRWLSRSWLQAWFVTTTPPVMRALSAPGGVGAAAADVVPDVDVAREVVGRLWGSRRATFAALSELPTVLCHLDPHRRNLLLLEDERCVAVDWSYVGMEVLGADASQLFASSAVRLLLPAAELDRYRSAIWSGYAEGLLDGGCPTPVVRLVRSRLDLVTAVRWGAAHLFWLRHVDDPEAMGVLEDQWWQGDIETSRAALSLVSDHVLDLTRSALDTG